MLNTTLHKIFGNDIYIYYDPVFQNQFLEELLKHDRSYKQLLDLSLSEMPWIKYRIKELFHSGKINQNLAFTKIRKYALEGDSFYRKFLSEILAYGCKSFEPDIISLLHLRDMKWQEAIDTTLPRKIGENYWNEVWEEINKISSIKTISLLSKKETEMEKEENNIKNPDWLTLEQLFEVLLGQYTPSFKIDKKEIMRDIEDEYYSGNGNIFFYNNYLSQLAEKGFVAAQDIEIEGLFRGCYGFQKDKEKAKLLIKKYDREEFWAKFL